MFQRPDQPEKIVERIQAGENNLRDQLLTDSMPEIKHLIRRTTRSFADEHDDEFTVALLAFNQAIDHYRPDTGAPFFSYASLVIKHRLYDWIRRQKSHLSTVSLSEMDPDEEMPLEEHLADPKSGRISQDLEIRESMLQLELDLQAFKLTLPGLTARFPKHKDSQILCIRIGRELSGNESLYKQLMEKRRLPGAELAQRCRIPVKTIEKNRANIILLALLMHSDLQVIQSYISFFEKEAAK